MRLHNYEQRRPIENLLFYIPVLTLFGIENDGVVRIVRRHGQAAFRDAGMRRDIALEQGAAAGIGFAARRQIGVCAAIDDVYLYGDQRRRRQRRRP